MWTHFSQVFRARFVLRSVPVLKRNFTLSYTLYSSNNFAFKGTLKLPGFKHANYIKYSTDVKPKSAESEIKRLLRIARSERCRLAGAVILLFLSSAVTMSVPLCVGKLIDILMSSDNEMKAQLITVCQILVAVFAAGAAANFGRVYLINISSQRVINNLRKKAYASILSQECAYFDKTKTGELINRLSTDTATVGMSITNNISDGLRSGFTFLASSSLMIYTSPTLASLGLVTVAPVAVVALAFAKTLKRNSKNVQDALASATQVAEERISNMRTVQAFVHFRHENELYRSKIDSILSFAKKETLVRAIFFGMTGFSGNLIILSVLYYGGHMMDQNLITIGGLSSFLLYAAYVGISIGGMGTFYSELMRGLGASSRLWEIIDRTPEISFRGGTSLPSVKGDLKFTNVTFAYPTRPDVPVLSDFSLTIPGGSVYALVGPSGCGKSTIASLVLRLYECQGGRISLDGINLKSLEVEWLRRRIGLVSQDPVLFSFSIRDNILYGATKRENVTEKKLERALHQSNCWDFVMQMPNGLDTVVGERGILLSGGQRQRIAICRAILRDPRILILDEATSALDAESEYLVQTALEDLMKDRTVITIAHRLSTVKKADVIVVLENGRVIEQGKYDDLIASEGSFHRLVQHQSLKA